MSAKTPELSSASTPLGKPGGPGLFHDRSLQLPDYIRNIAKALMRDGHAKSQAIQIAIGTVKRWARGGGDVKPEVRAAAAKAVAEWEAAKAKAKATPNKRDYSNDVAEAVEMANDSKKQEQRPTGNNKPEKNADGTYKLPPGAVGWKHNWVPVDANGNEVPRHGNSQAKDSEGHDEETKKAIAQAYQNKANADGKKAAAKAASDKKKADNKAAADKKKAETARKQTLAAAVRQAQADEKAGKPLTPEQKRLLAAAKKAKEQQAEELRHVSMSNEVDLAVEPVVGSNDGARATGKVSLRKAKLALAKRALKKRQAKKTAPNTDAMGYSNEDQGALEFGAPHRGQEGWVQRFTHGWKPFNGTADEPKPSKNAKGATKDAGNHSAVADKLKDNYTAHEKAALAHRIAATYYHEEGHATGRDHHLAEAARHSQAMSDLKHDQGSGYSPNTYNRFAAKELLKQPFGVKKYTK